MSAVPGVLLDSVDLEFPHRYLRLTEPDAEVLVLRDLGIGSCLFGLEVCPGLRQHVGTGPCRLECRIESALEGGPLLALCDPVAPVKFDLCHMSEQAQQGHRRRLDRLRGQLLGVESLAFHAQGEAVVMDEFELSRGLTVGARAVGIAWIVIWVNPHIWVDSGFGPSVRGCGHIGILLVPGSSDQGSAGISPRISTTVSGQRSPAMTKGTTVRSAETGSARPRGWSDRTSTRHRRASQRRSPNAGPCPWTAEAEVLHV